MFKPAALEEEQIFAAGIASFVEKLRRERKLSSEPAPIQPTISVGDIVLVPVLSFDKKNGERELPRVRARVVYVGEKFIVVNMGKYRSSFAYSDIALCE
ncbi:hypothetical protein [Sulfoacidibacillus thermotolerans]|uniref:Uncharacterized protein n=1 Tax=Sulfoacidibacillus thermotolerans TaxID=1765684 RepID=A0A2U3CYY2_SULT2|nr:hypothetical protein [Sulfoacidibacillus thermotolerans]PWI54259.1 hypothetical protein BM613_13825 [Sulfoacidibacillus thermotolerans]